MTYSGAFTNGILMAGATTVALAVLLAGCASTYPVYYSGSGGYYPTPTLANPRVHDLSSYLIVIDQDKAPYAPCQDWRSCWGLPPSPYLDMWRPKPPAK
jgi:hypothetical protein